MPIDRLSSKLQAKGLQLNSILENILLLEEDVFLLKEENFSLRFCVDFHDLRAYLALQEDGPVDLAPAQDRAAEEYARILFFNRLADPIILLPVYYMEFRQHVARFFGSKRESTDEKRQWTNDLSFQVQRVMEKTKFFVTTLEATPGNVSEKVLAEAENFAANVITNIKLTVSKMQSVRRAGGLLNRFDALVREKRLDGIRDVASDKIVVEKGSVYRFSRSFLDVERRGKSIANETDAVALSTIYWLNQKQGANRQRFYLVSGAGIMKELVDKLNDIMLQKEDARIELRDLDYWKLWFAISGKCPVPDLDKVREFKKSIWTELDGLAKRNDQLSLEFSQTIRQGDGRAIEQRAGEVERYLSDLDLFIESMLGPLKGGGWSLLMLEDILMPLRRKEGDARDGIDEVLSRISDLVKELNDGDQDIDSIKRILRGLLQELERLIWFLESEIAVDRINLQEQDLKFCRGWTLMTSDWGQQYRKLLNKIDTRNPESLKDVFQELSRLTNSEPGDFERYVVAARAYLESGSIDAAERELNWVDARHQGDAEYTITKALVHERRARFDDAQRIFEDLLLRHDEPVVRLHLAWLLRRKYSLTKDRGTLHTAIQQAKIAMDTIGSGPPAMRIEIAALYCEALCDLAESTGDKMLLEGCLQTIEALSEEAKINRLADDFGVTLSRIGRRLRRNLGSARGNS